MKRKSFKKALAGISAVAMLVSAMPMTLIADAYSSTSLVNFNNDVLDAWAKMADRANDLDGRYMYADTLVSGVSKQVQFSNANVVIDGNYDMLGTFDVKRIAKYQYDEVYATETPTGPAITDKVKSAKFDFALAEADLIEALAQQGNDRVTAIEFYENEQTDGAKFGLIKSVTMDMPVTTGNGGVNEWSHEVIKFTVVRDAADFNAFVAAQGSEKGHIILADSFDVGGTKQVSFTGDIDINLNGYTLTAPYGLQVVGAKMRLWNGSITAAGTASTSALGAYSEYSTIELYDKVTITHQANASGKAAIAGQGKLVFCGDAVEVVTSGAKAIDTSENLSVQAGDYEYSVNTGSGYEGYGTYSATSVADATGIKTQKIHKYNQYGFEVADRGTAATESAVKVSTKYVDVDARTENVMEYGYQPATLTVDNNRTPDDPSDDTNIYTVSNLGQLYWVAEKINSVNFNDKADKNTNLTVKITKSLDFNDGPDKLTWEPIEARTWANGKTLTITGESTTTDSESNTKKTYAVLKNMKVEAANGNGAFISEAGIDQANTGDTVIEYLGFENATVSAPNGYASVVVGEAYNTDINHVYVNNSQATSSVTGAKVGVMAGYLKNSTIDHTYTASKSAALYSLDSTTIAYLIENGVKTANGLTNFYDKTLYTSAGATAVYLVGATSTQFKNGEVAFRLNGNNPAQEVTNPVDWDNGTAKAPGAPTATIDYKNDVFGQTLGGTTAEYPTFIQGATSGTGVDATNRVYRVIAKKCTGTTEAWAKTGATFSNTELDPTKGSHVGTTKCSVCGAYKITTDNFDPVLIPYLSDTTKTYNGSRNVDYLKNGNSSGSDGWLCPTEIDAITTVIIDLTKADSTKTVDQIIAQIYSETAANKLKGLDTLNYGFASSGEFTANEEPVNDIRFVVEDSVVCRLDDDATNDKEGMTDAEKQKGFLVATGLPTNKFTALDANWKKTGDMQADYLVDNKVDKSTVVKVDETPNVTDDAKKTYSYYVSADQDATSPTHVNAAGVTNGAVAYPTASFAGNGVTYTIFFSDVTHNELSTDKNDKGVYDSAKFTAGVINKPVVAVNNKIVVGTDEHGAPTYGDGSTHNYVGTYCDCVLETKDCNSTASDITGLTHAITCSDCNHSATAVKHDFEVLFTIGNVTVKRCIGCGYVTAAKETMITAATPVLSRPDFYDDATKETSKYFRQSYDFSIAAGDGEIVSYGVIYKKNPTDTSAVDDTKLAYAETGKYITKDTNNNYVLNTEELKADGVNYTSRKAVKSSLTYRANISMPNVDDVVEIAGYVIYKKYDGTYDVKATALTKNSFEDVAYAEIENTNVIAEAEHYVKANNADREVFPYTFDIADDCKFINYGVLLTTNKTTPVTADTKIADANFGTKYDTADGVKGAKRVPSSDAIKSLTYAPSMTMNAGNTGTIRAYAVVEKYDLEWTIYTDVQSYTKPATP